MARGFKQAFRAAVVTGMASAATVGLFAPTASATENTWIMDRSRNNLCMTAKSGGAVARENCRFGDLSQLWDRTGARIKRAYSNQCLDSNNAGHVYWLECNGGNYQNWDYNRAVDGWVYVKNRQTGRSLVLNGSGYMTLPQRFQDSPFRFFGGE
ncbi:RICIN domain-containing protein [Streptomyces sp. NPDC018693]|uniref:RICIN domain-containing protein n=1 Tax=unclassified Streptomyces TaxID=2593676 RepID=UPI0037A3D5E2